jgi:two-component system, LuxR family, sensor kinase FixL
MNRGQLESLGPAPAVRIPPGAARVLLALAFTGGYLALDWVSYIHPMQQYSITPWNPQPALAIALLMLGGQRWLPVVFGAVVGAEWIVRGAPGSWAATLLIGAVLTLGYAAIARALSGRFAADPALARQVDAIRLVAVVAVGALATGVLYIAALLASGQGPLEDPFTALVRFWIGDAIGILVTLPVVLMLSVPARRAEIVATWARRETLLHTVLVAAALLFVFSASETEQVRFFYVLFLPLILVATRHGMAGSTVAMLVIQGAVIVTGQLADLRTLTVFEFQALLIALTVTGLFLGVTVDERRRAEAELRRTMRMAAAGEMAAALAHELNQPLTALATYARSCELMAAAPVTDRALLESTLAKLVGESARAAEVVRRLRDFFRTGATRLAPTALRDVIERSLDAVRARAELQAVALRSRLGELPAVLADELQLEVVLKNLLGNAIEAAAGGGAREVVIEARLARDREIEVTVLDGGPGVAPADAERIFEPFETTRATGMGMGLAISRAIVEAHGGRLWAEPGARGVFRLTLPTGDARHD